jgi:hypothetical protein
MSGRAVRILAAVAVLSVGAGSGNAQEAAQSEEDLSRIIDRLETQDRQAREDGFVLENFKVEQPENDLRRKSMQLSIGKVGGKPGITPFDERPSNFLLDPLEPYESPPVGLRLKLQF